MRKLGSIIYNVSAERIVRIADQFDARRKRQFIYLILFTVVGAAFEMISVGAAVPFLTLVTDPSKIQYSSIGNVTGISSKEGIIVTAALILASLSVLSSIVRIALTYVTNRFVAVLAHELAKKLFLRVMSRSYEDHVKDNSANVIAAFEKVNLISSYVIGPALTALSSMIVSIGIVILLVYLAPVAAMSAAGVIIAMYVIVGVVSHKKLLVLGQSMSTLMNKRIKVVQESLGSFREIVLDNAKDTFGWQFSELDYRQRRESALANTLSMSPKLIIEALAVILLAGFAAYYSRSSNGLVGALPILGAMAIGAQRLMPLAQNINTAYSQYIGARSNIDDVLRMLKYPSSKNEDICLEDKIISDDTKYIYLDRVSFDYDKGVSVLKDVSVSIGKGDRVGVIGRTGSGKSTFVDLIMGLLSPTSGKVFVEGVVLTGANIDSWQNKIAHVPQSIFLLDASIAANIAFAQPDVKIDLVAVKDAAQRADLQSYIEGLPDSYNTQVGERGVRLSGGQRQRLGIARALYKQASVLILDEATSALDHATEVSVMDNIQSIDKDITILMVAHRLSTIERCNVVLRFNNGRLVEKGTYEDIVK